MWLCWNTPVASSCESVGARPVSPSLRQGPLPHPIECRVAAAVAVELGIDPEVVVRRLASLPVVPNRLQRYQANAGYVVFDDTFNANPSGAGLALDALESEACEGRRVLVTPGMVELGKAQAAENAALAERAARVVTDLVVVGRTNRAALVEGCRRAGQTLSRETGRNTRRGGGVGPRGARSRRRRTVRERPP